jgi:RNA polymerase-binding transcription factor DksA
MATKKKAAKSAKKPVHVKKIAPAKKAASRSVQSSGSGKAVKKAPVAKSIAKAVAKKIAHAPAVKKAVPMPAKKPAISNISKSLPKSPAAHAPITAVAKHPASAVAHKSVPKEDPKKPAVKVPEKKEEVKSASPPLVPAKPEPKKAIPPPKPVKVIIPEMKTKTVRKYEPEFTKSVLDTPQEEQTGPTMRYSDSELGEFKELINRKLDAAKKELAYLQGLITRKDEMGGDNDDARYMTMEDGSMSMEREQLSQMASRQITFIDHLEKAIMRIENKTYGICRVTGKLIDKARLRAVPHATLSIEAKQMMNK